MDERKIIFTNDDGEEDELYVLEETRINGVNYLLVSDEEDDGNKGAHPPVNHKGDEPAA